MDKLRSINPDQMAATLRTLGQVIGAVIGTLGVQYAEAWATIGGPLITIALWAWGVWARSDANLLASAANVPVVKAVLVPSDVALAIPEPKVTAREPFSSVGALLILGLIVPALLLLPACSKTAGSTATGPILDLSAQPSTKTVTPNRVDAAIAKVDAGIVKGSAAVAQFCAQLKMAATGLDIVITKPGQQRVLDETRAGLDAFCAAPPRDVATALLTLAAIYQNVQAVRAESL